MKKFKIYEVAFKDGVRVLQPATSKKEAERLLWGNGDILGVVDVTLLYPLPSYYILTDVLQDCHYFTQEQVDIILRSLSQVLDMDYSHNCKKVDIRKAL